MDITPLIFDHFKSKFNEIKTTLIKAINQLDDQQVNWRPNDQSNSIANLVVHIQGNIKQRIGSGILGHLDQRNRDNEFDTELYVSKAELIERVEDSFDLVIHAVENLSAADLLTMQTVRNNPKTNYEVLAQCAVHYSEHLGQVLYIAKVCLGEDYQTTSIYKSSEMMKSKAVIFDLDNTLVDRKKAFRKFAERFIDRFVISTGPQHTNKMIEYIEKEDRDGYRKKRELYSLMLENLEMKNPETTVDDLLEFWFSGFYKCTVLMEGALEVLEGLKSNGVKIGLITNGSVHSQNSKIDEVNIRDYFDVIVVSDEVGFKKPDKRMFDIALKELNVNPQFAWYVGDHPINDIKGAKDAGLNAVWLQGFKAWDESVEQPDMIISELGELLKIAKGIVS